MSVSMTADYSARQVVRKKAAKEAAIQVASFVRAGCAVQAQVELKLIAEQRIVVDGGDLEGEYDDVAADAEGDTPLRGAGRGWWRLLCQIKDEQGDTLLEYLTDDFKMPGGFILIVR